MYQILHSPKTVFQRLAAGFQPRHQEPQRQRLRHYASNQSSRRSVYVKDLRLNASS